MSDKSFSAHFHAKYLHALEPIIRLSQTDFSAVFRDISGLMIEPCSNGGVILSATNGKVLAAVRDPDGKASHTARVTIPDRLFTAATPPKPLTLNDQGEGIEIPMPEWAQPGTVLFTAGFGLVLPQMPLPGDTELLSLGSVHGPVNDKVIVSDEYRVYDDKRPIRWRKIFSHDRRPSEKSPVAINPTLFAPFGRLIALFRDRADIMPRIYLDHGSPVAATFIRIEGAPDFIGAVSPMVDGGADPGIPDWAFAKEETQP